MNDTGTTRHPARNERPESCWVRYVVGLTLMIAWPHAVSAQTLRTETITEKQAAKAAQLGVEKPTPVEAIMMWAEGLPILAGTSGLYPFAGSVYPGTGTALGAGYLRYFGYRSTVDVSGGVAVGGSKFANAGIHYREIADGHVTVDLRVRHTVANDLHFYGLGPTSVPTNPLIYDYQPTALSASAAVHPVRWLQLSGTYQWFTLRSEAISSAPPAAFGFGTDLSYNVLQAGAALDWRPSPSYSTRGGFQRFTLSQYLETHDRPFAFRQFEYEGVQLVPILREQWILAIRVLTTLTTASDGHNVPVLLSPTLGGDNTLRAYRTRRYTDLNRVLVSGEYRWRPSRFIDMALFYDAGQVSARRQDLEISNMVTDWGIGIRGHSAATAAFRLEFAKGREGWHTLFGIGSPF